MSFKDMQSQKNEEYTERHELSLERIRRIAVEDTVDKKYLSYFQDMAVFLLSLEGIRNDIVIDKWNRKSTDELKEINHNLYKDILDKEYDTSYGNTAYAVKEFGKEIGEYLSLLYAEVRGAIPYAYENRIDYMTIIHELFIEVYNSFEDEKEPTCENLKDIIYWYASDYCDVFLADRIIEQIDPESSFATDIIMNSDLSDERYLYQYGEYITENEIGTLKHLNSLPYETLKKMADVYTEGYRIGFVNTGKDLSKKGTVNIRYTLGFEPVVKISIENFEKMGLKPVIYRAASSVITKRGQSKIGYFGALPNKQFDYDHRDDQALFMDKNYIERKLDVMKYTFETNKELAALMAGPAVMEIFGEKPFAPVSKEESPSLSDEQREISLTFDSRSGQITNEYIKGDERSFTIIAYPVPEIGDKYKEIFDEVIKINTLDAEVYGKVQADIIDALDKGDYVHVLGKGDNKTDIKVNLYKLNDPEKETIFENCVADVNIPVGEVFTSPVLEGTNGKLYVSKVYLNELQYKGLEIDFKEGMISSYTCTNFENEEDNKKYIKDNILHNHESLPIGEFAIGTNTTAYVAAKKYQIEDKMPILIAEKMGPHFAVGDTCYSWAEDIKVYNPNGKEIVARDNSVSILRKEDVSKAYLQCHTDITIPYEELEEIAVYSKDGEKTVILKDGRFVLKGTEILNDPFED